MKNICGIYKIYCDGNVGYLIRKWRTRNERKATYRANQTSSKSA